MAVQGNRDSLVELLLGNGARVVLLDLPPRFKDESWHKLTQTGGEEKEEALMEALSPAQTR